ncbi:pyridoxal-phosphate dependent enzyme [Candidatus Woesearchaeota archaeon]|nr:pyridoxal-phosphate dependent enzyme [Candidatus Woesearchaeota archaeon]
MLGKERLELYQKLEERIGNTPLVLYPGKVLNGNEIWIKKECDNPFGSHYDRVYLALFRQFEEFGDHKGRTITQGDKVLETTSGTAGVSFGGIGKLLGYECHVAIPEGVDKRIIELNQQLNKTVYFTPEKDYVAGFPAFVKAFLELHHNKFKFLNHSMGSRHGVAFNENSVTLYALSKIAVELLQQVHVDYFIPAVGNGSSILGPGRVFKANRDYGTTIVAFESFQSAVAYDLLYPGKYQQIFEIKPGSLPRHKMRGTSYQGIDFPHIQKVIDEGIVDDSFLVSEKALDEAYLREFCDKGHNCFAINSPAKLSSSGNPDIRNCIINVVQQMPHWDDPLFDGTDYGRSTRGGIAVALELAKTVCEKNFVVLQYDTIERYDEAIR